jgi:peptidoglycan/LPS O-acetylase OafA/YrhL
MPRRVAELGALRAFAALVVLLFHLYPKDLIPGWTGATCSSSSRATSSRRSPRLAPVDRRLPREAGAPGRPPCYLGLISYGINLHYAPIDWKGALKIGLTVALAAATWHLVERPIFGLKDRFRYDRDEDGADSVALRPGPRPTAAAPEPAPASAD